MLGSISAFLMISDDRREHKLPLSLGQTLGSPSFSGAWWSSGSYILSTMLLNRPLASAA
jgi:hypothetical protein